MKSFSRIIAPLISNLRIIPETLYFSNIQKSKENRDNKINKGERFKNLLSTKNLTKMAFLSPKAKLKFLSIKNVFIKVLILHLFDLKNHI